MFYRGYKKTKQDKFKCELKNITQNESIECYSEFEKVFVDILNDHGPFRKEILKG